MAVKLPDFTQLGGVETGAVNVYPGNIQPTYYGADPVAAAQAQLGAGLEKVGTGITSIASEAYQSANLANAALAQVDLHTKLARTKAEIERENDPEKLNGLYSQLQSHLDTAGELIPDPRYRDLWRGKHAADVVDAQLVGEKRQRTVYDDRFLAGANSKAEGLVKEAQQSNDPTVHERVDRDLATLYSSLTQAGVMDETHAQDLARKHSLDLVTGHALWLDANNRPDEAAAYVTRNIAKLPGNIAAQLMGHLRGASYKKQAQDLVAGQEGGPISGGGNFTAPLGPPIEGAKPEEQPVLNEVRHRESTNNYKAIGRVIESGPHKGETAKGGYGFLDSTWAEAAAGTGLGKEFDTADKAPEKIQDANALWLYRKYGTAPWASSGPYPSPGGRTAGLQPEFQISTNQMIADAAKDGVTLRIGSGYRTYEQQAALKAAQKPGGPPVAAPGTSEHEKGRAADIVDGQGRTVKAGSKEDQWLAAHQSNYNIARPVKGEPWHIQPAPGVQMASGPPLTVTDATTGAPGAFGPTPLVPPGAAAAAAPSSRAIEVRGDSLGVGLKRHGGLGGTAVGGASPTEIFNDIKKQPESHWEGLTVVLPSGSNQNEMPVVEETIKYLQKHKANVIAVGYGSKFPEKNAQLQEIAGRLKVPVIAAEDVAPDEGVHPSKFGYQRMADKIRALLPTQVAAATPTTVTDATAGAPAAPGTRVPGAIDWAAEERRLTAGRPPDLQEEIRKQLREKRAALEFGQEHNISLAAADLQTRLHQTQLAIESETDPAKIDALKAQVPGLLDAASQLIPEPSVRQAWIDRVRPDLTAVETVAGKQQRKVYDERYLAGANPQAAEIKRRAASSDDPAALDQATEELKAITRSALDAGVINPDAAQKADTANRQHLITDRIDFLEGNNRAVEGLQLLRTYQNELPGDDVRRLSTALQTRANKQAAADLLANVTRAAEMGPQQPGQWRFNWAARAADIENSDAPREVKDNAIALLEAQQKQTQIGHDQKEAELTVGIRNGTVGPAEILANGTAGTIHPSKIGPLLEFYDTHADKARLEREAKQRVYNAGNGGPGLDPKSEIDRKMYNQAYDEFERNLPPPPQTRDPAVYQQWQQETMQKKVDTAVRYGMLPNSLMRDIRGGLHSGNIGEAVSAANTLYMLRNANPALVNELGDEKDLRMAHQLRTYIDAGLKPEQAGRLAVAEAKVGKVEHDARTEAFGAARGKTEIEQNQNDSDWIAKQSNSFWAFDPNVDPVMRKEFEELSKAEYILTGNLEAARRMALDSINSTWGRTRVGGEFRYMKQAPEKHYSIPQLSAAENAAWMNEQLVSDMSKGGIYEQPDNPIAADRLHIFPAWDRARPSKPGVPPDPRPLYYVYLEHPVTKQWEYMTNQQGGARVWEPVWDTSAEKARREAQYNAAVGAARSLNQSPGPFERYQQWQP